MGGARSYRVNLGMVYFKYSQVHPVMKIGLRPIFAKVVANVPVFCQLFRRIFNGSNFIEGILGGTHALRKEQKQYKRIYFTAYSHFSLLNRLSPKTLPFHSPILCQSQ
jgi:hypothetical protein